MLDVGEGSGLVSSYYSAIVTTIVCTFRTRKYISTSLVRAKTTYINREQLCP